MIDETVYLTFQFLFNVFRSGLTMGHLPGTSPCRRDFARSRRKTLFRHKSKLRLLEGDNITILLAPVVRRVSTKTKSSFA